jgi:hypothetical protein
VLQMCNLQSGCMSSLIKSYRWLVCRFILACVLASSIHTTMAASPKGHVEKLTAAKDVAVNTALNSAPHLSTFNNPFSCKTGSSARGLEGWKPRKRECDKREVSHISISIHYVYLRIVFILSEASNYLETLTCRTWSCLVQVKSPGYNLICIS